MKVLLTGCTSRQANTSKRGRNLYFTVFEAYHTALTAAGHSVTWRSVEPGEDLSEYDVALVGLHSFASLSSQAWKFGALWAASQLPHVWLLEDWRVANLAQQLIGWNYYWKCSHLSGKSWDMFLKASAPGVREEIERTRLNLEGSFDCVCLPMKEWGDPKRIHDFHRARTVFHWDIDPWYRLDATPQPGAIKERRWMVVSLSPQEEFIENFDTTWDVKGIFTPMKARKGAVGGVLAKGHGREFVKDFVPETQLFSEYYEKSWGIILPYYGKAGMPGWWRNRYYLAAQARSILLPDPAEVADFTGVNPYIIHQDAVEHFQEEGLSILANEQYTAWKRTCPSREQSIARLNEVLANAAPAH